MLQIKIICRLKVLSLLMEKRIESIFFYTTKLFQHKYFCEGPHKIYLQIHWIQTHILVVLINLWDEATSYKYPVEYKDLQFFELFFYMKKVYSCGVFVEKATLVSNVKLCSLLVFILSFLLHSSYSSFVRFFFSKIFELHSPQELF